jgi:hypothetical protein
LSPARSSCIKDRDLSQPVSSGALAWLTLLCCELRHRYGDSPNTVGVSNMTAEEVPPTRLLEAGWALFGLLVQLPLPGLEVGREEADEGRKAMSKVS